MSRGKPLYAAPTPGLERVPSRDAAQGAPSEARRSQEVVWAKEPMPVRVWLVMGMNGHQSYHAEAEALCWTQDQVWVRYIDHQRREGWVWVWANAVERR